MMEFFDSKITLKFSVRIKLELLVSYQSKDSSLNRNVKEHVKFQNNVYKGTFSLIVTLN